jgi:hypothetical protein
LAPLQDYVNFRNKGEQDIIQQNIFNKKLKLKLKLKLKSFNETLKKKRILFVFYLLSGLKVNILDNKSRAIGLAF